MALAHYGWAVEEGYKPEFVIFTTTPITKAWALWMFDGHAQATVWKDGRRLWIAGWPDPVLYETADFPLGKYCWVLDLPGYIEYLGWIKEHLHDEKPLPAEARIEANWPQCKDLPR